MSTRYKLILSNKSIYREVDLSDAQKTVRIGTTTGCDIRLSSNLFFTNFELTLALQNDAWTLTCSDDIYISVDNVRKLMFTQLAHGDHLQIKYRASDNDVFVADFAADFDYAEKDYNRIIDISGTRQFSIGTGNSCDISLRSEFLKNDLLRVENQGDMLLLKLQNSTYGIYKNGQRVTSGSAKIRNRDFFSLGEYSFYYKDRQLYTTESSGMTVAQLPAHIVQESKSAMTYPKFNRSTRVLVKIPDEEIPVLDPPEKPQKPKKNLLLTILPSLMMVAMVILMRVMMSNSGGGNTLAYALMSAGMMAMGVVTSVITHFSSKKEYREQVADRDQKYRCYIEKKREEIQGYRTEERELLNSTYYDAEKDVRLVEDFSGELFQRLPQDKDYLSVRLGIGTIEAVRKVGYKKQEKFETDDELAPLPEQIAEDFKNLDDAPIVSDFNKASVIGVVGSRENCYGLLKNMTLDLAVRHYYKEVKLFFLISEEDQERFRWLRLLPHVFNDEMGIRNIAYDSDSRAVLFEYLYRTLSMRVGKKDEVFQRFVIFAFDSAGVKSHPLSQFMENANELGTTFVFFDRDQALLPLHCSELIRLSSDNEGSWIKTEDEKTKRIFRFSPLSDTTARRVAIRLAPVYCEEVSLESSLTKSISLFELLGIYSAEDLDLSARWASSAVDRSMAAPLGVKTKNEVVSLDLHDKAHGPHGLVAGTTGSGKSEILQSYVLSMATLFHPYEVSFVIIDFKGGGMANQFKNLPHLVGTITNIDGKEIDRSLRSIKAELLKRQECFAEAGVNHIDKYIRLYKNGEVTKPLPHLIVIVDEFAELKAEQPEFMKELISAARIGRSLGVHLILATQKPAGQVNEQIWSNSRFKLCLKVQTKEDSNEVLKSPLAAEIREPGRAYLQVGNNEIFDLFQSGYSGAPEKSGEGSRQKSYQVSSVDLAGQRHTVFKQKKHQASDGGRTQLEAVVDFVHQYCAENNIRPLPQICLPPLPGVIPFPKYKPVPLTEGVQVEIGMFDDPDSQLQDVIVLTITGQNTMIIGSSQYGKTTLLQTIIRGLTEEYTAQEVNLYIIDFASMVLKNFEALPHVGGVVCTSEDEKLRNLFKLLLQEIEVRKQKLVATGVSSFSAYLEAGYTDLPQIVLLVDNVTALKELYLQDNDVLLNISREGVSVGLSVVLANTQTSGFGYRYLSNYANRIGLFCNDAGEYSTLFNTMKVKPSTRPGSCLVERNKQIYEGQIYQSFAGEREIERVEAIRGYISSVREKQPVGARAKPIPLIPEVLTAQDIRQQYGEPLPYHVAVGLDYSTVEPLELDLTQLGTMAVSGRKQSGKTTFVRNLLMALEENRESAPVEVWIIDDIGKKLGGLRHLEIVKDYSMVPDVAVPLMAEWESELQHRYASLLNGDEKAVKSAPLLLLIAQNTDVADAIAGDKAALQSYKTIFSKFKALKVCVIYTNLENTPISFGAAEPLKMIKDQKHFMIFEDLGNVKLFDIPLGAMRQFKKEIELGDAYYVRDNSVIKVRTVHRAVQKNVSLSL